MSFKILYYNLNHNISLHA